MMRQNRKGGQLFVPIQIQIFSFLENNQRERNLPANKSKMLVLRDDVRVESSIRVQSPKACNKQRMNTPYMDGTLKKGCNLSSSSLLHQIRVSADVLYHSQYNDKQCEAVSPHTEITPGGVRTLGGVGGGRARYFFNILKKSPPFESKWLSFSFQSKRG